MTHWIDREVHFGGQRNQNRILRGGCKSRKWRAEAAQNREGLAQEPRLKRRDFSGLTWLAKRRGPNGRFNISVQSSLIASISLPPSSSSANALADLWAIVGLSHPPCSDGRPLISPKAFVGLLIKVGSTLLVATSIALRFAGPNIEFPCYLITVWIFECR